MKSFCFRFGSLLKLRENAAGEALENYVKVLNYRKKQEKELELLEQQYDALQLSVTNAREHTFTASYQIAFLGVLANKEKAIGIQKNTLGQAFDHERSCLSLYLKCKRDFDILQKLRDKHYNVYKESIRHLEEKQIEECVVVRASARLLAYK